MDDFTPRELSVVRLLRDGVSNYSALADKLGMSIKTAQQHVYAIEQKIKPVAGQTPLVRVIRWSLSGEFLPE